MRAEHLYVHVPFCARRCVYCDFAIAVRASVPVDEYSRALRSELELRHRDSDLNLRTLYFGGGTPSKLGGVGVAQVMDVLREFATLEQHAEVTIEANPEDVTPEAVARWRAAGVNRVSLGVQSFDDDVLEWMHRTHDSAAARRSVETLRAGGIDNISIDLIFAMPDRLSRSWTRDLDLALGLGIPHLSIYGLTVESHTPLGRWVAREEVAESPEEEFATQFLHAHELLLRAGYDHYEVSNYGRPGAHSRHNWAYWERKHYVGVGPSAHEFDGRIRRWNVSPYAEWVTRLARASDPIGGTEALAEGERLAEEIYLGLRTSAGLATTAAEGEHLDRWIAAGWANVGGDHRLRLTAAGWLRLDSIAADLTLLRSRY